MLRGRRDQEVSVEFLRIFLVDITLYVSHGEDSVCIDLSRPFDCLGTIVCQIYQMLSHCLEL